MYKRTHLKFTLGLLVVAFLLGFGLFRSALSRSSVAQAVGPIGIVCTSDLTDTFNLQATSGYLSTPDGNSVFMWAYAPASGAFQMPGPTLCVTQGDTVTINLTNNLPDPPGAEPTDNVSMVFPGQTGVTAAMISGTGTAGLFTLEAGPGETVQYTFTASEPGTYLYESGTNPHKQVHMGLYGALIVRPALGDDYAYNDATTRFNPAREYLLLLHDFDPALHLAVERGEPYDVDAKHDRYWTINGRSFPDTILENFVPWLPNQPIGALVQIEPFNSTSNPYPALLRYLNAGMANHPFHPHANHLRVIARDGRLLVGPGGEDTSFEGFTRTLGSGQTADLLLTWTDVEAWTSTGNPVPVEIPGLQNLVFKDGVTFYSGNPYLGAQGDLPPGVTSYNQCGEFYFPWHSHALNEFQNFDEGFGGLATVLRVDPPGGCP